MIWNEDSPRECTRFFELDWYDGIEAGLFSIRDGEGNEQWFVAQRTGKSYGVDPGDHWYLYDCTRVRGGFEPFLDAPDPTRERFVEEGFFEAAIEPVRERIDDSHVMLTLFVGNDHRRVARIFFTYGLAQLGSALWSRLFPPVSPQRA